MAGPPAMDAATKALENLSLAANSQSNEQKPLPPPRATFPLPRELRDEIYSYLLDRRNVRKGSKYRFHTDIIAVNKSFQQEGEEYLHKHQTFVLVSYKCDTQTRELIGLIPKASEKKSAIQKFKHHSIHIHLRHERRRRAGPESAIKWFLMLDADLSFLAATFQLIMHDAPGKALYITHNEGVAEINELIPDLASTNTSVAFKLLDTKFKPWSGALQIHLFDSLQGMLVGNAMKFTFQGVVADQAHIETMRQAMSPRLIWPGAHMWGFVRALWEVVIVALAEFDNENFAVAHRHLEELLIMSDVLFPIQPAFNGGPDPLAEWDGAGVATRIFQYDMLVSLAWIALRTGNTALFDDVIHKMTCSCFGDRRIVRGLGDNTFFSSWHILHIAPLYTRPRGSQQAQKTNGELIDDLERNLKTQEKYEFTYLLAHDVEVMKKYADRSKPQSPEALPIELCAARTMKLPLCYSQTPGVPKPSRKMLGWQDRDALEKLTDAEKKRIHEKQKELGFALTDFSKPSVWTELADRYARSDKYDEWIGHD